MTERKRRTRLSAAQRVEVWRRWKAGQSLHEIGRAIGKAHVVIRFLLARYGGIARRFTAVPVSHSRWQNAKTSRAGSPAAARFVLSQELESRSIHREPRGDPHGGPPRYRASEADHQAWESAFGPKRRAFWRLIPICGRSLRVNSS
jgi:hypothetical protein